ncbi:MAG: glycosyltransferase A (GT-A) superfamily protein (DUF2064 family) [Sediminicola sp.]|jgi:glycosyltransferase A (GT-A) superfamily protein (DUF2064 family)
MTTAVLVFAYSPSEEVRHKPIPKANALYYELTAKTLQTVEKSGLSYFLFTEHEQTGSNFGERFTNAIQAVFDHGFDKVITIGNDTPELKASQIKSASIHLDKGEFVLGPSTDGGFYLMGIHKSHFDASKLMDIPWQTNRTATAVLNLVQQNNISVARLETLSDLDCISDLKNFIKYNSSLPPVFIDLILSILGVKSQEVPHTQNIFSKDFGNSFYNKGSPIIHLYQA